MTFFVQTRNVNPMDRCEFPSTRQFFELLVRVSTLHREQSPAADTERARPFDKALDGSDCARQHAVETRVRFVRLCARMHGRDIVEAEQRLHMIDEPELLR